MGGELHVLKGIDLEVNKGEIVVILGPSGSGKSTLLHILGTLDSPTQGEVFLDGETLFPITHNRLADIRNKNIGFIFQFHQLLPEFTAIENVTIPSLIQGKNDRHRAKQLLEQVGLKQRDNHIPAQLSGGEKQRVAVARALMNNPKIVLADEPSGNLDTQLSDSLHKLIQRLSREREQTFVIVTHKETLTNIADKTYKLINGKLIEN